MNIKKYFVQEIHEGEMFPPFFMPVLRYNYKLATEAWILPLAPIVWLIRVLQHVLWCIWDDCIRLQHMLYTRNKSGLTKKEITYA